MSANGGFPPPVIGSVGIKSRPLDDVSSSNEFEFMVVDSNVKTVLGLDSSIKLKFINHSSNIMVNTSQRVDTSSSNTGSQEQANANNFRVQTKLTDTISDFKGVFNNGRVGCLRIVNITLSWHLIVCLK